MDTIRLGDILDDYCTRCRLLTNHSAVAMVGESVKKVRCRTCNHEHDYRQGQAGTKKKKASAYEQVLASVLAGKEKELPAHLPAPAPARRRARSLAALRRPAHRPR